MMNSFSGSLNLCSNDRIGIPPFFNHIDLAIPLKPGTSITFYACFYNCFLFLHSKLYTFEINWNCKYFIWGIFIGHAVAICVPLSRTIDAIKPPANYFVHPSLPVLHHSKKNIYSSFHYKQKESFGSDVCHAYTIDHHCVYVDGA